jgi:alpha 1,2-mannosyltransferase
MTFLRTDVYEGYMDALDKSGGFFYQRYGDAPIRTLAMAMFLNPNQTHYFSDVGYFHAGCYTCPVDEKKVSVYNNLCKCDRRGGWIHGNLWW